MANRNAATAVIAVFSARRVVASLAKVNPRIEFGRHRLAVGSIVEGPALLKKASARSGSPLAQTAKVNIAFVAAVASAKPLAWLAGSLDRNPSAKALAGYVNSPALSKLLILETPAGQALARSQTVLRDSLFGPAVADAVPVMVRSTRAGVADN